MRSSRGQYALEGLLIMGIMIGFLGLLLTQGVWIVEKMQKIEQDYFERQFADQLDQVCRLLGIMGPQSQLTVEGFLPEKTSIRREGNYFFFFDANQYCPGPDLIDRNWHGHFFFTVQNH